MEIITFVWNQYLYIPLFNLLIFIYQNYAFFNLGLAIIILTFLLRFLLLPFTLMSERGKVITNEVQDQINQIATDYADDPVKKKEAIRAYLKKKKIRPWAKTLVLFIQGIVLLLLYQVFIGGINSQEKFHLLYPSIPRPDFINTNFLWMDIAERDMLIAALVAGYLFAEIIIQQWLKRKRTGRDAGKKEVLYILFFPAAVFLILALLPSVKALFILTSLIFSSIISTIVNLLVLIFKTAKKNAQAS